jgi:hypothetical protein
MSSSKKLACKLTLRQVFIRVYRLEKQSNVGITKYVHIMSTTVYAPRRNWDSPNPFLASECSPPPRNMGEGAH